MRWLLPPPEAARDFQHIARVSEFRRRVPLRWIDDYRVPGAPRLSAGVTAYRGPVVIGVQKGIRFMSQPLVDHGWSEDAAVAWTARHVLAHEAGHVRQLDRGDRPPLSEDEANDWAYVVFLRLGWDTSVTEYLVRRWPPGTLWREYSLATGA